MIELSPGVVQTLIPLAKSLWEPLCRILLGEAHSIGLRWTHERLQPVLRLRFSEVPHVP